MWHREGGSINYDFTNYKCVGKNRAAFGCLVIFFFFSKKKKSQEKPEDKYRKHYIVKSAPAIMTIVVFSFLLFTGCLIGTYMENQLDWFVGIGFGLFSVVSLWGILNIGLWKLEVDCDNIRYRSTYGVVKNYKFSEITEVVYKGRGTLMVYIDDKKIFTINDNIDTERFMQQVKDLRIHTKWK